MLIAERSVRSVTDGTVYGIELNTEHTANAEISSITPAGLMEMGCSDGAPLVTMVQPAHFRDREDPSRGGRLDRPGFRAVLLQCQMRPASNRVPGRRLPITVHFQPARPCPHVSDAWLRISLTKRCGSGKNGLHRCWLSTCVAGVREKREAASTSMKRT